MTTKTLEGITVSRDAMLPSLETSPIACGESADELWWHLKRARFSLIQMGTRLPYESDASQQTMTELCKADEILLNLLVRISPEEPTLTASARIHGKT